VSIDPIVQNSILRVIPNVIAAFRQFKGNEQLHKLREMICYNQSSLADFNLLSGKKHKLLKEALELHKATLSPDSLEHLRSTHRDLEQYFGRTFDSISRKNFEYFLTLFECRTTKRKPVRFCVKAIGKGNCVITLSRSRSSLGINDDQYPLNSNTAFERIIGNQRPGTDEYYLCNNIPRACRRRQYNNARIDMEEVQRYPSTAIHEFMHGKTYDESWQACWERLKNPITGTYSRPDFETCYKSTLVIPIAFRVSDSWLSTEFCDQFSMNSQNYNCFGFLCLDHQNINFFNEEQDVDLGYIFADIIALYLIQRLNCTDYSSLFQESSTYM
jgi:hypothetical protein